MGAFTGPKRFEIEGADAARAFAREEGLDDRRLQLIRDTVALNSTPSIALYPSRTERNLSFLGSFWTLVGPTTIGSRGRR
jgi:hypothetical protein